MRQINARDGPATASVGVDPSRAGLWQRLLSIFRDVIPRTYDEMDSEGWPAVSTSHWTEYHRRWARLTPPLRPNGEVADAVRQAIAGLAGRVLLLGVTPELSDVAQRIEAIDRSETMIAHIWPGDSETRRASRGDWLDLAAPVGHFTAAIGDGSLNALTYPHGYRRLLDRLAEAVRPGGRFAVRTFVTPDPCESLEAVREAAMAGEIRTFHAFKWRLAMAMVTQAGDPNIEVARILEGFYRLVPDRSALAKATGWAAEDIDTIDVYRGSAEIYSFPTFTQLCAAVPDRFVNVRQVPSGTYELAERCPLIVMDVRS